MKSIKTSVLVAIAAFMTMAFISTSSATAEKTVPCKVDEHPCEKSNRVTHLHETSVGKAKLKSSLPTIECNVLSLGEEFAIDESPETLLAQTAFTYSSCNNFCTVKEEGGPGVLAFLRTASELASVTMEVLTNVKCPFINCNYIGTGLEGHGLGPLTSSQANGSVVITEQSTEKESGSCPEEQFLTITSTPLSATYISS